MVGHNLLRHSICESISCARHSSADCFAEYQEVRLEVFKARVAAGPSADRVGLIDDHESAVFARYFPQFLMVARFGVNDPHIGHHWFSQYTSDIRSEEHTSELQSRQYLVCRLLLEKKNRRILHMIE